MRLLSTCIAALVIALAGLPPVTGAPVAALAAAGGGDLHLSDKDNDLHYFVQPGSVVKIVLRQDSSKGSWKADQIKSHAAIVAGQRDFSDASSPAGEQLHEVYVKAAEQGDAAVILSRGAGGVKSGDVFIVYLHVGAAPADAQEAIKMFATYEMQSACGPKLKQSGTIDSILTQGPFVLASYTCSDRHGEIVFKMQGTAMVSGAAVYMTSIGADGHLGISDLVFAGVDRASASQLVLQRQNLYR